MNPTDLLRDLVVGFNAILTPYNLYYCFLGSVIGTVTGVLPGIGPLAALSLLLPVTLMLPPVASIAMLCAIFYGAMYGGSITSILLRMPGEAASVVTCIDGPSMARNGRGGAALAISAIGSFAAGTFGIILLTLAAPSLARIALSFGPPEYFGVMLLSLVSTLLLVNGSHARATALIGFGLFVSTIGLDVIEGEARFTFGSTDLTGGVSLVAVIIGMFGLAEILENLEKGQDSRQQPSRMSSLALTRKEWRRSWPAIGRGSIIGFALGVLPGGGPVTASFLSYAVEKRCSRFPEEFGRGAVEGVAGPESANNAAVAGSMVPLLSLGIAGNAVTALLLGALIIQGVQPGPMMLTQNAQLFWAVIASMYVGNIILLVLNLPLVGVWVQLLRIPHHYLFACIIVFAIIGAYSENKTFFDVWMMLGFTLVGYLFRKCRYDVTPFVLALVLGPLVEQSLRQSMMMSLNGPLIFVTRPICASLIAMSVCVLGYICITGLRRGGKRS